MSTFGERLKYLRSETKMTQKELAMKIGVTRSAISLYEINRSDPNNDIKKNLASIFKVSLDYLCGYSDIRNPENVYKNTHNINLIKIPLIKSILKKPIFSSENIDSYIFIDANKAKNSIYFFYRICDNSMSNARIMSNDLVFVEKQTDLNKLCNGDIVLIILNKTTPTLRRVLQNNTTTVLISENRNPSMVTTKDIKNGTIEIIGKIIQVLFKP